MSLQDKIEQSSLNLRRKLFDNQITMMGKTTKVLRLKIDVNEYNDANNVKIISQDLIECIIQYPGEIPITRGRTDEAFDTASNPHLYLFDILPISLYTKWQDNVEKYDILIDKISDERRRSIKFILQVSEIVATFRSSLLWIKRQCAPYNGPRNKQMDDIIGIY